MSKTGLRPAQLLQRFICRVRSEKLLYDYRNTQKQNSVSTPGVVAHIYVLTGQSSSVCEVYTARLWHIL